MATRTAPCPVPGCTGELHVELAQARGRAQRWVPTSWSCSARVHPDDQLSQPRLVEWALDR